MLTIAGSAILTGTLHPPLAALCFTWLVPLAFTGLTIVMMNLSGWVLDTVSVLLILGCAMSLRESACTLDLPEMICNPSISPIVPALLAISGPATLIFKFGPDDPILLCWLGSTLVGLVPVLPTEIQEMVWKPGVVSPVLIFAQVYLQLRTRRAPPPSPVKSSKKIE